MLKFRGLILAGALAAFIPHPALAEGETSEVKLGRLIEPSVSVFNAQRTPVTVGPTSYIGIRGGLMFLPRGAGVLGVDLTVPTWTIGEMWVPQFDLDALIGADLDGDDTAVSLTGNVVRYFPNAIGSRNIYFGGGIGIVFGGGENFQAKLILGTPITERVSAELNTHFIKGTVAWTILGRLSL